LSFENFSLSKGYQIATAVFVEIFLRSLNFAQQLNSILSGAVVSWWLIYTINHLQNFTSFQISYANLTVFVIDMGVF
jgi:hypothetical protein